MSTLDFLQSILPSSGYYCLAKPVPYSGKIVFRHYVTKSAEDMALVAKRLDSEGVDVYYSVCSLNEPHIIDKHGKKRVRVKSNVAMLRAIYFDVDVLKPHELELASKHDLATKYTSREEALSATKKFCAEIKWPLPTVIDSGWGFHFYWRLEEDITPDQFESLMQQVKVIAQHNNYKLDAGCTDTTRVLRVVGTHNHKTKDDRKVVRVLRSAPPVAFNTIREAVNDYTINNKIEFTVAPKKKSIPDYLNFGESNIIDHNTDPLKLRPMVAKCGALREFVEAKGNVPYHYWMHSLQILRFVNRGRELCHRVSSGSENYTPEDTDKILDSLEEKDIPPTLCETMAGSASACKMCPLRGKIRTPATLGREKTEIKPDVRAEIVATNAIPPAPWPFQAEKGKGVQMGTSQDGVVTWDTIYKYDLLPIKRVYSEREQAEQILWHSSNPADGEFEIIMPAAALYERRAFVKVLADAGMYPDLHHVDDLRNYMVSYTQVIQNIYAKETMYMQMGWRDGDQFILSNRIYSEKGIAACETERNGRVVDALGKSGTLDEWKGIVDMFQHEDFAGHQFGIGTAFGAPLMRFTGLNGGIINMMGRSGEGKSTVQRVVNSVWGNPNKLMLPAEARSSTYNAKISFINQMNNLPICAEEITNTSPEDIGSLSYAITQGSEKWRADIKGSIREAQGGWCTTLLSSANSSLHEKLHKLEGAVAKALRVFEYPLHHVQVHNKSVFRREVDMKLIDNYGHAGDVYIHHITQNLDAVKQRLKEKMIAIDNTYEFLPEERVWSALIATNLVGLEIAKEIGLINFNIAAIEKFIHKQIRSVRAVVSDIDTPCVDVLSEFLSQNISNMLIVETATDNKTTFVLSRPSQKLFIRHDTRTNSLDVAITALKEWAAANGLSYGTLVAQLEEQGLILARSKRVSLGKGTDIPAGQCRVLAINADSPAFSHTIKAVRDNHISVMPNIGVFTK